MVSRRSLKKSERELQLFLLALVIASWIIHSHSIFVQPPSSLKETLKLPESPPQYKSVFLMTLPPEITYPTPTWKKIQLPPLRRRLPPPPPPPPIEELCEEIYDCNSFPWPKRIAISHVIGDQEKKCIPFATHFTTFEIFFAPVYQTGTILPFLDLRGHRFDNNSYAANIGIGGRSIPNYDSCFCEMLGFNAYYDYRQGCIGYYQQFGLGIEVLGAKWDFRANAYVPFGRKKHIQTSVFNEYVGDYYAIRKDIESVSYSFNGEIGCLLFTTCNFLLYAAAGPYFLARKCGDSTPGGEIRIRPQYKDYLALDLSWRYDKLFETIWQAEIIFSLPLYQLRGKNQAPCCLTDRQIYQPVERFEVLPLNKRTCWFTNF